MSIKLSEPISRPKGSVTTDVDSESLDTQMRVLHNKRFESDTEWRCRLSWWVIGLDSVWVIAVILILVFNSSCLHIDTSVLITLLGTTTLNVLGLAFIVLRGLFEVPHPR